MAGQISTVISTATVVVGLSIGALKWYNSEQEARVQRHNTNPRAHTVLLDRIDALEAKVVLLEKTSQESEDEACALGEHLVRLLAADAETDPKYKMAAANYYSDVYKKMVAEGADISAAIRDALNTPWYRRPRR